VAVPNGGYDIFFLTAAQPGVLYMGDSFALSNNNVRITLTGVANGNYALRRLN
jgi:hypothetical protein